MDCREKASDVTASQQNFRACGNHDVIKFFQQVIAAISAAHADERGNVLAPPEFMELMHAPINASGKIKVAIKNLLRVDRLVAHLAQAVAACKKTLMVEAAGGSND